MSDCSPGLGVNAPGLYRDGGGIGAATGPSRPRAAAIATTWLANIARRSRAHYQVRQLETRRSFTRIELSVSFREPLRHAQGF